MADLRTLDSSDLYTVGWISALDLELAAATAMLDEIHELPAYFTPAPSDDNVYIKHWPLSPEVPFLFYLENTWGAHVRIAQHNKGSLKRIVDFLRNEQVPGNPFAICTRFTNRYCAEPKTELTNPLYYAIMSEFDDIVLRLLEHDVRAIEITPDELSGGLEIAVNTLYRLEKNFGQYTDWAALNPRLWTHLLKYSPCPGIESSVDCLNVVPSRVSVPSYTPFLTEKTS
ncbi:hypothetical protein E4T47_09182 [Aureobasidium subglaciale]|nr:hypothetical protein E4T47_09182 [Aureobasidium subglaciale]